VLSSWPNSIPIFVFDRLEEKYCHFKALTQKGFIKKKRPTSISHYTWILSFCLNLRYLSKVVSWSLWISSSISSFPSTLTCGDSLQFFSHVLQFLYLASFFIVRWFLSLSNSTPTLDCILSHSLTCFLSSFLCKNIKNKAQITWIMHTFKNYGQD
jgi:hypothetical protein